MTPRRIKEIKEKRLKVSTKFLKRELSSEQEADNVFKEIIKEALHKIGVSNLPQSIKENISSEVESYFRTGNCGFVQEDKVCINPSFLEPDTEEWRVHYASCPYDGNLPLPVNQLNYSASNGAVLQYCQQALKNFLLQCRQQQKKVLFHFHLGDALQLCYRQPKRFNIIDASNLSDHIGLANVLNAARCALVDDPNSILRTESMTWPTLAPSLLKYVETALCSPVSLFPVLYGFRLLNSVGLGDSKPVNAVSAVLFKWHLSPIYEDLKFEISADAKASLASLKNRCFFLTEMDPTSHERTGMKSYTPLTYCYVVGSLIQRFPLLVSHVEPLFSPELLPPFSLTWRAFNDWMAGRPVFHVKATIPGTFVAESLQLSKLFGTSALRLVLVPNGESLGFMAPLYFCKLPSPHTYMDNIFYIDNLEFLSNMDKTGEIESLTVSFFLPENHGLESTYQVFVVEAITNIVISYLGSFRDFFRFETLQDRQPFDITRRQHSPVDHASILKVDHCLEFTYHYEIQVSISGNNPPSGLEVTIDQSTNCDSSHRVILSLSSPKTLKPFVLTLPWPVTDDLKATLRKSQRVIQLHIKKAIYEPWPSDFTVSSKWSVDSMKEWDKCQFASQFGDLKTHLMMQFSSRDINSFKKPVQGDTAIREPLNELRETILCLFIDSTVHGRTLFTIHNKNHPDTKSPDWFMRVHLPVRVSPEGSSLLCVTALDHRRTEKLIALDKLREKQAMKDFLKIFQADGEVTSIVTYTDEEARLLRYMLRLNSTRITPNSWEAKHLSKNQNGSWIPTYVCPLYGDHPGNSDELKFNFSPASQSVHSPQADGDNMCSRCHFTSNQLKRCARCKKVKYCNVQCQRTDWSQHKAKCFA